MVDNAVLDRLAKLIELQSRPGSPAEAEAAAARIQSLLTRHQLSLLDAEAMLTGRGGKAESFITSQYQLSRFISWRMLLLNAVSKQNFCRSIRGYERTAVTKTNYDGWRLGSNFTLVGREENIAAVIRLYEYLEATIDRLGQEYSAKLSATLGPIYKASGFRYNPKGEGIDFRNGAVIGVAAKLYTARNEAMAESGSSALVLVEEDKLDEAVAAQVGVTETGKAILSAQQSASFQRGVAAGFTINTDAQLTDSGTTGTLRAISGES